MAEKEEPVYAVKREETKRGSRWRGGHREGSWAVEQTGPVVGEAAVDLGPPGKRAQVNDPADKTEAGGDGARNNVSSLGQNLSV